MRSRNVNTGDTPVMQVMVVNERHPKVDLDRAVRHQSLHVIVLHKLY